MSLMMSQQLARGEIVSSAIQFFHRVVCGIFMPSFTSRLTKCLRQHIWNGNESQFIKENYLTMLVLNNFVLFIISNALSILPYFSQSSKCQPFIKLWKKTLSRFFGFKSLIAREIEFHEAHITILINLLSCNVHKTFLTQLNYEPIAILTSIVTIWYMTQLLVNSSHA